MRQTTDVIVLGAGAAGLACASAAGRRGRRVVLVDHGRRAGAKVMAAGGGRCNFSNRAVSAENYVSGNPHFVRSALARFGPGDFLRLLDEHGVGYVEEAGGRLFCRRSGRDIVEMLLGRCGRGGVEVLLGRPVRAVARRGGRFVVETAPERWEAEAVVVATGGLSWPQLGASDLGHRVARQFGLGVTQTRPGLAGLVWSAEDRRRLGGLAGIAARARVRCGRREFVGDVLFTHKGFSGPAILQASLYWRPGEAMVIDWLPEADVSALLRERKGRKRPGTVGGFLSRRLPERLVRRWSERYFADGPLGECTREQLEAVGQAIQGWSFTPGGTAGFRQAEVTVGGVDTTGLSSRTMEAKDVPGLYFIGEVLDVTGQLGGYNLHWAWASGWSAGQAV